jgi:pimeloyl-ACP methyl ester carboxylesterase
MFPFGILRVWVIGIAALGQVIGACWYLWSWWFDEPTHTRYLIQAIAMLIGSFAVPILAIAWPGSRKHTEDEHLSGETRTIVRPDGTRLHVEMFGPPDAQAIVFTHGWTLGRTVWPPSVIEQLSQNRRVVVWDLPGIGHSASAGDPDYSVETLAGHLQAVIDSAGPGPVLLVGHSLGGMITQTYVRLHPQELGKTVVGLVLIATTYTNPIHTAKNHRFLTSVEHTLIAPLVRVTRVSGPLVRLINWLTYANGSLHLIVRLTMFVKKTPFAQLDQVAKLLIGSPASVTACGMQGMMAYDATDALSKINVPVLLIAGDRDRWTPVECDEFMLSRIPNARLEVISPAGHMLFMEYPERVTEMIETFFAELDNQSNSGSPALAMNGAAEQNVPARDGTAI